MTNIMQEVVEVFQSANDLIGHWTTVENNNPINTNNFSLSNYTDFTIMYKQKILSQVYSSNYTIQTI